ncbi:MAG: type II toxin-antitoxin system PemK/MazF family toxin [Bacillota bacterium]
MTSPEPLRGEIWLVDWSPGRGSEQSGVRPALIIQNDIGNTHSTTTIVAAISTKRKREYPFHVAVEPAESGLRELSIIKLEQITTIDKERLIRKVGMVQSPAMMKVELALKRSLALE